RPERPHQSRAVGVLRAARTRASELVVLTAVNPIPGERQRRSPGTRLARREHLVDRDPSLVEGVGAAREVEAPDARDALAGGGDRGVEVALEIGAPEAQRLGVVRAQALDVVHLELL